jgi:hypothetical protein
MRYSYALSIKETNLKHSGENLGCSALRLSSLWN